MNPSSNPPFDTLEMDMVGKRGSAWFNGKSYPLLYVVVRPADDTFLARWQVGANHGMLEGIVDQADKSLKVTFSGGTVRDQTQPGRLIDARGLIAVWPSVQQDPTNPSSAPPANAILPPGVLPVGRFSPAPGIFIDRTLTSVSITGAMELYGPEANASRAYSIQHAINETWSRTFDDGYSVSCNIMVKYRASGSSAGHATQIEAIDGTGPSHVSDMPGFDRSMTLNSNDLHAFTWVPTHEFGHILGLKDRYSESIMSKVLGELGYSRTNAVNDPRYKYNLMAVHGGVLESINVRDLALENAPSWISDDVQVRDWVMAHSTIEIGMLSAPNKLKMIQTLMSGWVSDADMDAIIRICGSVTSKAEADSIRDAVDPLDLTSIGQRTSLRHAFRAMPGGEYAGQGVR